VLAVNLGIHNPVKLFLLDILNRHYCFTSYSQVDICDFFIIISAVYFSAADVGTDMFEIDCHITSDGEVVVSHDNKLHRTTGEEGLITETLYKVCIM
jgi:hypothetical protein